MPPMKPQGAVSPPPQLNGAHLLSRSSSVRVIGRLPEATGQKKEVLLLQNHNDCVIFPATSKKPDLLLLWLQGP